MFYLFVLDDPLTRFTTRTEQLTKCCEPLQKLRVRLGTCKNTSRKWCNQKEIPTPQTEGWEKTKMTLRYLYE